MKEPLLKTVGKTNYLAAMAAYPIFDESYRSTLNDNIYNYYQEYNISIYNSVKWLSLLSARMTIIMPKYNQLYKSLQIEYNPLENYDEYRTLDHTGQENMQRNIATDQTDTTNAKQDINGNYTNDITGNTTSNYTNDETIDTTNNTKGNSTSNYTNDETIDTTNNVIGTDKTVNTGTDYVRNSDTPQGNLSSVPNTQDMTYYATDASYKKSDSTVDNNNTTDTTINTTDKTVNSATSNNNSDTTINTTDKTVNNASTNNTGKLSNTHTDATITNGTVVTDKDVDDKYNKDNQYTDTEHKHGTAPGSNYSKMLQDYRDLAINIDEMIIEELEDLFFTIFSPSDFSASTDIDVEALWPYWYNGFNF